MNEKPTDQPVKPENYQRSDFLITDLEFVTYMDAHFESTECPQCKKDDGWTMDAEPRSEDCELPDGVNYMRVYRLTYAENARVFRPFLSMACIACGSTRNILCENVKAWLAAGPKETEE